MLEARSVAVDVRQEGRIVTIFKGVSLALEAGEIVDLVGPSGSGKTTLLRVLARLHARTAGTLLLRGVSDNDIDPVSWRLTVLLVPQKPVTVPGTVRDNLLLPWTLKARAGQAVPGDDELMRLLSFVKLDDVGLARDGSQLSVGQVARIALCRSFLTRPKVLLLDEVDAALDAESADAVAAVVSRLARDGTACVRVRHRPPDGLATRRLRLAFGALSEEAL